MKTKHTTGEWSLVSNLKNQNDLHIHFQGKSICEFPEPYSNPDTENNANAKLLVQAPKMAVALLELLRTGYYNSFAGAQAVKVLEAAGIDISEYEYTKEITTSTPVQQ